MQFWKAWYLLCSPGWPRTHGSSPTLPSQMNAGITGICPKPNLFEESNPGLPECYASIIPSTAISPAHKSFLVIVVLTFSYVE